MTARSPALRMLTGSGCGTLRCCTTSIGVVIGLVQYTLPLLVMLLFGVIQNDPA